MTTDPTLPPQAAPSPDPSTDPLSFRDDDIVYVDPDARKVVGRLEWNRNGNPKSMPCVAPVANEIAPIVKPGTPKGKEGGERRRGSGRKYYPFGTYKSMKNAFKLEGKQKKADPVGITLDDVIGKATTQAFWN